MNITEEVDSFIDDLTIPSITLYNRSDYSKISLREMISSKLHDALTEQNTTNTKTKYFEYFKEDFSKAVTVEDFAGVLEKSYTNNGETYSDEGFSFFNTDTNEDDYSDYFDDDRFEIEEGNAGICWDIVINGILINNDIFQNNEVGYECVSAERQEGDLKTWIKEKLESDPQCSDRITDAFLDGIKWIADDDGNIDIDDLDDDVRLTLDSDGLLMLDDLRKLQLLEEQYIMSSINTNEYISFEKEPKKFNEICEEILSKNNILERKNLFKEHDEKDTASAMKEMNQSKNLDYK